MRRPRQKRTRCSSAVARRCQSLRAGRRSDRDTADDRTRQRRAIGGLKVVTAQGWFAARPSGTEAVYKLYAESFRGSAHLRRIQEEAQALIGRALAGAVPMNSHIRWSRTGELNVTVSVEKPLPDAELHAMHAYWRACNYLAVGMIYLRDNPLLHEPLTTEHVKHRLLGHWGASPALSFVWVHLNRMIVKHDLDMMFVAGPGHGAPGVLGAGLSRGHVLGDLSGQEPGRGRDAAVLQAVLLPGSHRQPRHAGNARVDPRGWRAWLQPLTRVRHGVRQSRSDRGLRHRRR